MNKEQYQTIFKEARVLINQHSLINLRDYRSRGFYYGEFYHDFVILKTKVSMGSVRKDSCQCQTFGKYGACEHTMALRAEVDLPISWEDAYVELHDEENEKKIEAAKVDALSQFMDSLQNHFLVSVSPEQLQPLKLYYQLDYAQKSGQTAFYLRLYVNNGKRNYLIKNIHEFLTKCYFPDHYKLTPKVSIAVAPECFTKEDLDFIRWLMGTHLGHLNYVDYREHSQEKEVVLDSTTMDALLEKFPNHLLKITVNDQEFTQFHSMPADLDSFITCHIQKVDENLVTLFFEDDFEMTDFTYLCAVIKGQLYRLDYQSVLLYDAYSDFQQKLYRYVTWQFDKLIYGFDSIFRFSIKEANTFLSKYLPVIQKFAVVDIDPSLSENMIAAPLVPKFYFSEARFGIQLDLTLQYGDIVLAKKSAYCQNADQANQLIRDIDQENRIEQFILANQFVEKEASYQLLISRDEDFYHFLKYTLTQFAQFGEVILDQKLQEMFVNQEQYKPKLSIIKNGGFLDVAFEVDGIELEDVERALVALSKNAEFVRLNDGRLLDLSQEEFQKASESVSLIRQVSEQKANQFQMPLYRGGQLAQIDSEQIEVNQDFTTFVQHLTHPQEYPVSLPSGLNASLRPYQLTGFRWLKMLSDYQLGGILADEMGLGKTLQTITYLLSEKQNDPSMKALIIVPASLVYNWYQECKQFAPELKVQVVNGGKDKRAEQLETEADVYVTSYQSFRQDEKIHAKIAYQVLFLDEAQMVKNSQTKTAQALRKLTIPKRFALSGTPVENRLDELWSIFQVIIPGFFPSKAKFRKFSTELIAQMIQPFVLRRTKEEVLLDLPERIEINYFNELSKEQKEIYLAQLEQIQKTLAQMNSDEFKKNRISILAGLTRLRQICCSPQLYLDDFHGESGKLEQLKELLIQALENNRRILIFSQFASMLNLIEAELAKLDIPCFKLDGSTPSKQRMEMVEAFNQGDKPVFLISLKAGGTGLNLTGANTVILYDLWWNPAVEDQATSRAHRMGQKEVVEVWRLITEGTIEEKIYELQQSKRELFDQVMQGDESSLSQLTEEDIRQIFQVGIE